MFKINIETFFAMERKPMETRDFAVRVPRSTILTYPEWLVGFQHNDLYFVGPREYNLVELSCWLHPAQRSGEVSGELIYSHLKETNALPNCIGLADLLAIQEKGIAVFRVLRLVFRCEVLPGWRSVGVDKEGNLHVPFLCENNKGNILLFWQRVDNLKYSSVSPAFLFPGSVVDERALKAA
jgi:hypothetical protein